MENLKDCNKNIIKMYILKTLKCTFFIEIIGSDEWIRTADLTGMNRLL